MLVDHKPREMELAGKRAPCITLQHLHPRGHLPLLEPKAFLLSKRFRRKQHPPLRAQQGKLDQLGIESGSCSFTFIFQTILTVLPILLSFHFVIVLAESLKLSASVSPSTG